MWLFLQLLNYFFIIFFIIILFITICNMLKLLWYEKCIPYLNLLHFILNHDKINGLDMLTHLRLECNLRPLDEYMSGLFYSIFSCWKATMETGFFHVYGSPLIVLKPFSLEVPAEFWWNLVLALVRKYIPLCGYAFIKFQHYIPLTIKSNHSMYVIELILKIISKHSSKIVCLLDRQGYWSSRMIDLLENLPLIRFSMQLILLGSTLNPRILFCAYSIFFLTKKKVWKNGLEAKTY